MGDFDFPTR